ncbi:DUF3000 domain-containing protein [Nocardioides zeae]|uniref:DUF3000 domain-containing protein n=1 Tax=Nocardioides imazamoxiresistens TaxID=3231893 RepID=A0ABU3PYQ2_9ACTN|nr:DUF3000 domain-containing protein [Nocardioides zeae]MDT9593937.1 DUF3000 domain-containing protein [Nocardioides zeae]
MPAGHDAHPGTDPAPVPRAFADAVAAMRAASVRPEVRLEEMTAPRRIATYAFALTGDVVVREDELATGRIILLHEPDGNDAWEGTFRCVTYVRAETDAEAVDEGQGMMGQVGWSWLTEALEAHGAEHHAAAGTVTCVVTQGFGQMADEARTTQVEIRASWTPSGPDLARHVAAWADLMCQAGGIEPVPDGVAVLPNRRRAGS